MGFIDDCERYLRLFVSVHNRHPKNGEEFAEWCEHVKNNSQTIGNKDNTYFSDLSKNTEK